MVAYVYGRDFEIVGLVENFVSFIWTERRLGYGDFELYLPFGGADMTILRTDNYIGIRGSETMMIIESIEITTDVEDGDFVTVTGRSLESILDRRVIWGQFVTSAGIQNTVEALLNENLINPSIPERKIGNFVFSKISGLPETVIERQYFGDNLYEAVVDLCEEAGLGYTVRLNDKKQFVFSLTLGNDRSYAQEKNPYVIFSPKFENLSGSNYFESLEPYRTAALVAGEGDGSERMLANVTEGGSATGLDRREIYVDGSDISQTYTEDVWDAESQRYIPQEFLLEDSVYLEQLAAKGTIELLDAAITSTFEGNIETNGMFTFGVDYFAGDIVQVTNEYGMSARCRVSEVVQTEDGEGLRTVITFEHME